jgi:hypothetical protein
VVAVEIADADRGESRGIGGADKSPGTVRAAANDPLTDIAVDLVLPQDVGRAIAVQIADADRLERDRVLSRFP